MRWEADPIGSGGRDYYYYKMAPDLGPRLVAGEIGAGLGTVATVITVAFRLYFVILVQTMTN